MTPGMIYYIHQESKTPGENGLHQLLKLMKKLGHIPKRDLAFCSREGELFPGLNAVENILLERTPELHKTSLTFYFDLFSKHPNPFVSQLALYLDNHQVQVDLLNAQEKKIVALLKLFFRQGPTMALDHPEEYLSPDQINLVFSALDFERQHHHKKIFVSGPDYKNWSVSLDQVYDQNFTPIVSDSFFIKKIAA